MRILILFLFLGFFAGHLPVPAAATSKISGFVFDAMTGANVPGVSFYGVSNNRKQLLCQGDSEGRFGFDLTDVQSIVMERSGYRTANTPITVHRQDLKHVSYFVKFPLIPLDKQVLNSPYMQSEQRDFTLADSPSNGRPVVKTLRAFDALTGKQIERVMISLIYTKTNKTEKREIIAGSASARLLFTQTDIIGFIADAPGYQTYSGNLIVERLDGGDSAYELRLSPQVNLLSVYISGGVIGTCSLVSDIGEEALLQKSARNVYSALTGEGTYRLKILRPNGALMHSETVNISRGINLLEVASFDKSELPPVKDTGKRYAQEKPDADSLLLEAYALTTIYFNQSEYVLKPTEKSKLDSLVTRLRLAGGQKVRVVGHTDNVGDPKRNLVLSEYRARVIRSYLLNLKVPENQISFTWVGGKFPARRNDSEDNKKLNRRVEIIVLPKI